MNDTTGNVCGSAVETPAGILLCGSWPPEVGEEYFNGRGQKFIWDGAQGVLQTDITKGPGRLYRAVDSVVDFVFFGGWMRGF